MYDTFWKTLNCPMLLGRNAMKHNMNTLRQLLCIKEISWQVCVRTIVFKELSQNQILEMKENNIITQTYLDTYVMHAAHRIFV